MTEMRKDLQKRAIFEAWKAVKRGQLIPEESCEFCKATPGKTKNGRRRIQGHHWKGYAPENWLNVLWLCPSCHKKEDGPFPWTEERKKAHSERMKANPIPWTEERRKAQQKRTSEQRPWDNSSRGEDGRYVKT